MGNFTVKYIYPTIQFLITKEWYDYYGICFFHPYVDKTDNKLSISFPTEMSMEKEDFFFTAKFLLAGFGIGIVRQNGY